MSNFVSSVGQRVNDFERSVADFTCSFIAVVNGTVALHSALLVLGFRVVMRF